MSPFDRNIFELQPLEIRRLLTTAQIDPGAVLHVIGTGSADTITLNQLSNGRVSITGVGTQFTPGSQFTTILIEAGGGNDTVSILNNVTYNSSTITGNAGNDTITGGKSGDTIYGADGNDNINGGVANDYIDGNAGNDVMAGGDGLDTANYSDRTSAVRVTLNNAADDGQTSIAEADNVQCEQVLTGAGNDTLTGTDGGSDYLSGGGGADQISGLGGNDELTAGSGGDNLQGGQGDDYLHAQNNDRDTVNGGTGPGATDHDLAEVDGLDVAALVAGPAALNPDVPNNGVVSANPADLDPTYGTGGKVNDGTLNFEPVATAIDSQGRVVYVGTLFDHQNSGTGYGDDMVAIRYDANGNRDSTFGGNGVAIVDFTSTADVGLGYNDDDVALGVVIGANDSIFVLGSTRPMFGGDSDSAAAKLTSAGVPDATFGSAGKASHDASGDSFDDRIFTGVQQSNGALVVLGSAGSEGSTPRLFRFTATGGFDSGFGQNGQQGAAVGISNPNAVAVQTLAVDEGAQRVVIGGALNSGEWQLERYTSSGTPDSTFGTSGIVTHDFGGTSFGSAINGLAIDANQNILAAGYISNFETDLTNGVPAPNANTSEAVLGKFAASNGAFIDAASHNGVAAGDSAFFYAVTVDPQGRYVVVGSEEDDQLQREFLVARINSNMQPDNTFGLGGVTLTSFNTESFHREEAYATRVVAGGKILAAGTSFYMTGVESDTTVPVIARYRGGDTTPPNGEGEITEVEGYINYQGLHQQPPSPDVQAIFDRISEIAKNNLLWQPDDKGIVRVELDDRNNSVKFTTATTGDGKLNVGMNVDGIQTIWYDPTTTKEIQIFAKGGNDVILANNSITIPLLVDAGNGNDIVAGGANNDVIFGGAGIDLVNGNAGNDAIDGGAGLDALYGDGGRDIVIGGADADAIAGGGDDDIQIGGTTSYDAATLANADSLKALIKEWQSGDPVNLRITHIRSGVGGLNGSTVLRGTNPGATVFNDGVIDILTNDPGNDWFFAHTTGPNAGKDQILFGLGTDTKDEV